jgi:hypothetical protein
MKIRYSTTHASQRPSDSLPRLEMMLSSQGKSIGILGLVDSGSTINVLPYQAGLELGFRWDANKAGVRLSGNLAVHKAIPVMAMGEVGSFEPVHSIEAHPTCCVERVPIVTAFCVENQNSLPAKCAQTSFEMRIHGGHVVMTSH